MVAGRIVGVQWGCRRQALKIVGFGWVLISCKEEFVDLGVLRFVDPSPTSVPCLALAKWGFCECVCRGGRCWYGPSGTLWHGDEELHHDDQPGLLGLLGFYDFEQPDWLDNWEMPMKGSK